MASISKLIQLTSTNNIEPLAVCQNIISLPLHRFHLFPKLPLEIREMIWEFALPNGSRILRTAVSIEYARGYTYIAGSQSKFMDKKAYVPRFYVNDKGNTALPTLHTCREARQVPIKHYPVHLPTFPLNRELRLGPNDVLEIDLYHMIQILEDDAFPEYLSLFGGLKRIWLIEDYNDATLLSHLPPDFVDFPITKDRVPPSSRDPLFKKWALARKLEKNLSGSNYFRGGHNMPEVKIRYQEQARLSEIARRSSGIDYDNMWSPLYW
ncbi:hypothetical protein N431DRAFT_462451 [Stipitochalara longipes BDJ]|nr:hypothetical protein N431DRAFT_462451 [Stipitochalara longipes BDJ]